MAMLCLERQAGWYEPHTVIIILNMVYVHYINMSIIIWEFGDAQLNHWTITELINKAWFKLDAGIGFTKQVVI